MCAKVNCPQMRKENDQMNTYRRRYYIENENNQVQSIQESNHRRRYYNEKENNTLP